MPSFTNFAARSGISRLDENLDDRFQVHPDPGLLADSTRYDLDLSKGRLDRGGAISIGDGGGGASNEPASTNHD